MRSLPLAMLLMRHAAALQRCTPSLRGIRRGQLQMSTTKKSVTIKRGKARLFRDGNPLVYGGAAPVVYDETGRWPCDGWAPGRVLAELSGEPFRL